MFLTDLSSFLTESSCFLGLITDGFFLDGAWALTVLLVDLVVFDLEVLLDLPEGDGFLAGALLVFGPRDGLRFLLAMYFFFGGYKLTKTNQAIKINFVNACNLCIAKVRKTN